MNDIEELVDLPDPEVQLLVHPLDLPEARRIFRRGWAIMVLADPAVVLCITALVWFASRNPLAPLVAGSSLLGFGALAGRYYLTEAWAFVPRRRQDRDRVLPVAWDLAAPLVFGVLLGAALVLTVARLGRPDVPDDVRAFTFGMAAAVGLVVVADFVWRLMMQRDARRRRTWLTLPGVLAVVAGVAVATTSWFTDADRVWSPLAGAGAATMLAIGAAAGGWRLFTIHRERAPVDEQPGGLA